MPKADRTDGLVVVHNVLASRPDQKFGEGGFRFWVQKPDGRLVVCKCCWAPHLKKHYRRLAES
jgi:hypothetical protein